MNARLLASWARSAVSAKNISSTAVPGVLEAKRDDQLRTMQALIELTRLLCPVVRERH